MKTGILGGGQLARMLALAGVPLGARFSFVDPSENACAGDVGRLIVGEWDDRDTLMKLADCDHITCEFENVPARALEILADAGKPVRPAANAFAAAQDRLVEKRMFESLDIAVAPFAPVSGRAGLLDALDRVGWPAVLKTRRMGYDGKGQYVLYSPEDLEPAWAELGGNDLILERLIDFDFECSITAVRSNDGQVRCYPLSRTIHEGGILRLAASPAGIPGSVQKRAEEFAQRLLAHLDYVGCLTLELFADGDSLLANEFAPRVHNSAHWTIEGAVCSQFENHVRAVCDLPLGSTDLRQPSILFNWIGRLPAASRMLETKNLHWHDYNKQARPGRKVGHATLVADSWPALQRAADDIRPLLPDPLDRLVGELTRL